MAPGDRVERVNGWTRKEGRPLFDATAQLSVRNVREGRSSIMPRKIQAVTRKSGEKEGGGKWIHSGSGPPMKLRRCLVHSRTGAARIRYIYPAHYSHSLLASPRSSKVPTFRPSKFRSSLVFSPTRRRTTIHFFLRSHSTTRKKARVLM